MESNYHFRRQSTDHPTGYQQDPRAAEMTASQRAIQELQEAENNSNSVNGFLSTVRRGSASLFDGSGGNGSGIGSGLGGGFVNGGAGEGYQEAAQEAWNSARKFFGSVGEKLGEVEGEVWRRVNGRD